MLNGLNMNQPEGSQGSLMDVLNTMIPPTTPKPASSPQSIDITQNVMIQPEALEKVEEINSSERVVVLEDEEQSTLDKLD